jgi:hypothetical protein
VIDLIVAHVVAQGQTRQIDGAQHGRLGGVEKIANATRISRRVNPLSADAASVVLLARNINDLPGHGMFRLLGQKHLDLDTPETVIGRPSDLLPPEEFLPPLHSPATAGAHRRESARGAQLTPSFSAAKAAGGANFCLLRLHTSSSLSAANATERAFLVSHFFSYHRHLAVTAGRG